MSVTLTTGTQPATQAAWQQMQLAQAKQFAERAAQNASALQSQANSAQTAASQAQANARSLNANASQAQSVASQAERNLRATEATNQIGPDILQRVTQAAQPKDTSAVAQQPATQLTTPPVAATVTPTPTLNTQGQTIGAVINVTA